MVGGWPMWPQIFKEKLSERDGIEYKLINAGLSGSGMDYSAEKFFENWIKYKDSLKIVLWGGTGYFRFRQFDNGNKMHAWVEIQNFADDKSRKEKFLKYQVQGNYAKYIASSTKDKTIYLRRSKVNHEMIVSIRDLCESYNGTNWTAVNTLNTGRRMLGLAGTNTSALAFGGGTPPPVKNETESWNGSNWTEVNNLNTARERLGSAGADNTSALAFGGGPPDTGDTELWNGSNWTEFNNMNSGRRELGSCGIATAALGFGGGPPPSPTANTESWNGTNWTEVNNLNTARYDLSGAGITTSALAFGGDAPPVTGKTEQWNGVSWVEVADLSTARYQFGQAGANATSALAFGGILSPGANTAATEKWSGSTTTTKTVDTD